MLLLFSLSFTQITDYSKKASLYVEATPDVILVNGNKELQSIDFNMTLKTTDALFDTNVEDVSNTQYTEQEVNDFSSLDSDLNNLKLRDLTGNIIEGHLEEQPLENAEIRIFDISNKSNIQELTSKCNPSSITDSNGQVFCTIYASDITPHNCYKFLLTYSDNEVAPVKRQVRFCLDVSVPLQEFQGRIESTESAPPPGITQPSVLCIPISILFGFFIISMYYAGKSPFVYFDLITPRLPSFKKDLVDVLATNTMLSHRQLKSELRKRLGMLTAMDRVNNGIAFLSKLNALIKKARAGRYRGYLLDLLANPAIASLIKRDVLNGKITNIRQLRKHLDKYKGFNTAKTINRIKKQAKINKKLIKKVEGLSKGDHPLIDFDNVSEYTRFMRNNFFDRVEKVKFEQTRKEIKSDILKAKGAIENSEIFDGNKFSGPLSFLSNDQPIGKLIEKIRYNNTFLARALRPFVNSFGSSLLFFRKSIYSKYAFSRLLVSNFYKRKSQKLIEKRWKFGSNAKDAEKFRKYRMLAELFEGNLRKKAIFGKVKNYYEEQEVLFENLKYSAYMDMLGAILNIDEKILEDSGISKEDLLMKFKLFFQEEREKHEKRTATINATYKLFKFVSDNDFLKEDLVAQKFLTEMNEELHNFSFNKTTYLSRQISLLKLYRTLNKYQRKSHSNLQDYFFLVTIDLNKRRELEKQDPLAVLARYRKQQITDEYVRQLDILYNEYVNKTNKKFLKFSLEDVAQKIDLTNSDDLHYFLSGEVLGLEKRLWSFLSKEAQKAIKQSLSTNPFVNFSDFVNMTSASSSLLNGVDATKKTEIFNELRSLRRDFEYLLLSQDRIAIALKDKWNAEKQFLSLLTDKGLEKVENWRLKALKQGLLFGTKEFSLLSNYTGDDRLPETADALFYNPRTGGVRQEDWKIDMQRHWRFLRVLGTGGGAWDEGRSMYGQVYGSIYYSLEEGPDPLLRTKGGRLEAFRERLIPLQLRTIYENYLNDGDRADTYSSAKSRILNSIRELNAMRRAYADYTYLTKHRLDLEKSADLLLLNGKPKLNEREFEKFLKEGAITFDMLKDNIYGQAQEGYAYAVNFKYKRIKDIMKEAGMSDEEIRKAGNRINKVIRVYDKSADTAEFDVLINEKTAYVDYDGTLKNITPVYGQFNNKILDAMWSEAVQIENQYKEAKKDSTIPPATLRNLEQKRQETWDLFYDTAKNLSEADKDRNDYVLALYKGAYMDGNRFLRSGDRVQRLMKENSILLLPQNQYFSDQADMDNKNPKVFGIGGILGKIDHFRKYSTPFSLFVNDGKYSAFNLLGDVEAITYADIQNAASQYLGHTMQIMTKGTWDTYAFNQGRKEYYRDLVSNKYYDYMRSLSDEFMYSVNEKGGRQHKIFGGGFGQGLNGAIAYQLMRDPRAGYRRGGFDAYAATQYYMGQGNIDPPELFASMGALSYAEKLQLNRSMVSYEASFKFIGTARASSLFASGINSRFDKDPIGTPKPLAGFLLNPGVPFLSFFANFATRGVYPGQTPGFVSRAHMSGFSHLRSGVEKNLWDFHRYYKNMSVLEDPPGTHGRIFTDNYLDTHTHPRHFLFLQIADENQYLSYDKLMDLSSNPEQLKSDTYRQYMRRNINWEHTRAVDRTALGFAIDEDQYTLMYSLFDEKTGKGMFMSVPRIFSMPIFNAKKVIDTVGPLFKSETYKNFFNRRNNFENQLNKIPDPSTRAKTLDFFNQNISPYAKVYDRYGFRDNALKIAGKTIASKAVSVYGRVKSTLYQANPIGLANFYTGNMVWCSVCHRPKKRFHRCPHCGA